MCTRLVKSGRCVKRMNPKNTIKSPIHENVDENITCDFGDGDISRLGVANQTHVHIQTPFVCSFASSIILRLGVRSLANASRARQFNPLNPPGVGWVNFFFKVRVSIRTCMPNFGAVRRERFLTIYNPLNPPGVGWVKLKKNLR